MATYDLEEQEQLDTLKAWWKQHGNLITWSVLVVTMTLAGWRGWGWWQQTQAVEASALYVVLQSAVERRDTQRIKGVTGELLEKYGSTSYAPMAALLAGKSAADGGDLKTARVQLSWAVDHANGEINDLARLRLAAVLLDEKAFDDALKHLGQPSTLQFAARFADLRGDVLLAQGKRAEAKAAYQLVLTDNVQKSVGSAAEARLAPAFRELVQQKLDALGES